MPNKDDHMAAIDDRHRPRPDWELPPEPPIHRAARRGDLDQLGQLLAAGADINERADLELKHGPHLRQVTPLMTAARSLDGATADTLRWLVEHGANVRATSEGGCTAAWFAAGHGARHRHEVDPDHAERLRFLLDQGLDPNESSWSSLVLEAIKAEDPVRLQLLLERGASPHPVLSKSAASHPRPTGDDAFYEWEVPLFAAMAGPIECLRLLLAAGADPNYREALGGVPLMEASSAEQVRELLAAGADPNARIGKQEDALQAVLTNDSLRDPEQMGEIVDALVAAGAELDALDAFGDTRLYHAAFARDVMVVQVLLARGADPQKGRLSTPLHAVCWQGESSNPKLNEATEVIIRACVAHGADVNTTATEQRPLHDACWGDWGNATAVRVLLELGADVDPLDSSDNTPLVFAAERGELACVRLLLDAGASVTIRNGNGDTPIGAAMSNVATWESIVAEPPEGSESRAEDRRETLKQARECLRLLQQAAEAQDQW